MFPRLSPPLLTLAECGFGCKFRNLRPEWQILKNYCNIFPGKLKKYMYIMLRYSDGNRRSLRILIIYIHKEAFLSWAISLSCCSMRRMRNICELTWSQGKLLSVCTFASIDIDYDCCCCCWLQVTRLWLLSFSAAASWPHFIHISYTFRSHINRIWHHSHTASPTWKLSQATRRAGVTIFGHTQRERVRGREAEWEECRIVCHRPELVFLSVIFLPRVYDFVLLFLAF